MAKISHRIARNVHVAPEKKLHVFFFMFLYIFYGYMKEMEIKYITLKKILSDLAVNAVKV